MPVTQTPSASLVGLKLVRILRSLLRQVAESIVLAVRFGGTGTAAAAAAEEAREMTIGNGLQAGETGADDSSVDLDQAAEGVSCQSSGNLSSKRVRNCDQKGNAKRTPSLRHRL